MFCSINAFNECITSEVCVDKYSSIAAQSIMNYDTVKKEIVPTLHISSYQNFDRLVLKS